MFKKILVPTDGSEMALQAAVYARALAEKFQSEITIVHVIQNYYSLPSFSMPDTVTIPLSVLEDLEASARIILDKTLEIFNGYPGNISTRMDYGPPGKQIIDIAVDGGFSLIVMGRRGIGGVTELLLGSVSNHIVHHSPCPTLVVRNVPPTS